MKLKLFHSVSPTGDPKWDVVMWMDHRATKETEELNGLGEPEAVEVRKFVGGTISVEMQVMAYLGSIFMS